jgi:hypothetical protein
MARRENFYLDTRGGAYVLQVMAKSAVQNAALKIAAATAQMSGSASGHKANVKVVSSVEGIGGKPDARRATATIVAMDSETEAQLRNGGYVQKSISAGKV